MAKLLQSPKERRVLLDRRLTEVSLFIKKLCPTAVVEVSTTRYEDEDAHIMVFPPETLSEKAREKLEEIDREWFLNRVGEDIRKFNLNLEFI